MIVTGSVRIPWGGRMRIEARVTRRAAAECLVVLADATDGEAPFAFARQVRAAVMDEASAPVRTASDAAFWVIAPDLVAKRRRSVDRERCVAIMAAIEDVLGREEDPRGALARALGEIAATPRRPYGELAGLIAALSDRRRFDAFDMGR